MTPQFLTLFFSILTTVAHLSAATRDLPPGYEQLSATEKQAILWTAISANPYSLTNLPTATPGIYQLSKLLRPSYDAVAFTQWSDEMPIGRNKLIHIYGSAAKVELKIFDNSTYTGIFNSGGIGIARLSLASQDYDNFVPGMGLKILVDGQPSQNFQVINSLDGQGTNHNFFQNSLSNIVPQPSSVALKILGKVFEAALKKLPGGKKDRPENAATLGLYEQASITAKGEVVTSVKAPYRVTFVPNAAVGWSPDSSRDLRVNLDGVPSGSLLYTVVVKRTPTAADEVIGVLQTTSGFVASDYGDQTLYFRHASKRWRA